MSETSSAPKFSRHAVITGASSGIGLEFARQVHASGMSVTLVARRLDKLERLSTELNSMRVGSAQVMAVDLSNADSIQHFASYLRENQVDLLVNNAGCGSFGPLERLDISSEAAMITLNVLAPTVLSHAVIPQMKLRRSGMIIMLSSVLGYQPVPFMTTYSATKAFDLTFGLALREELRSFGVSVLTVCPGPVDTEFSGVARLPGKATGGSRDSATAVVSKSLTALQQNRAVVVPGWRAKLIVLPSLIFPAWLTTKIARRVVESSLPESKKP